MPSHQNRRRSLPQGLPFSVWWRRGSPHSSIAKQRSTRTDRYTGVRVLPRVPELRGPVDAQQFFERFVATRTPVIVRGGVHLGTMAVLADDAALEAAAGDCQLQVEVRSGTESFGRGNRRRMRFDALLGKVASGATQYYLTTQELPELRGGGEQLVGPPLSRLGGCFPLRPPLLPSLVPQSVNLWLGRAAGGAGASSGLHHDFHDNLYCLLRGRKSFRLFPPSDAGNLYTHGALRRIHRNGRINYQACVPPAYMHTHSLAH